MNRGRMAGRADLDRSDALARPRKTTPRTPELAALGAAVQRLRIERELTQEQLADRAGHYDSSRIGKVEIGQLNPTFTALLEICSGLGISFEELGREVEKERAQS